MSSTLLFDMSQLERVKEWLFTLRKHYSQHSDIWDLCRNWDTLKNTLLGDLNSGLYEFDPLKRFEIDEGVYILLCSEGYG
jgi:hypothetical protein